MKTKVIVITGGVYSSLGKGIVASSIGCILKHGNFKIAMLKLDPYLNTDPGLLSPMQHGEVFITSDGQKTDLDLGHYERFTGLDLNKSSTQTGGKLYTEILNEEKSNKYHGATIQIVPHFTQKIIDKINYAIKANNHPDFLIIEIGGTVGDIESLAFIEALRLYNAKYTNVLFIHCSPLFRLNANDEIKTKPTQHSIKNLRNLGINPSILILRFSDLINNNDKEKLAWTCDINANNIFVSKDCKYLYEVPKILYEQGIQNAIMKYFKIKNFQFDMHPWQQFLDSIYAKKNKSINICICGQYTELNDSYLSIIESLKMSAWKNKVELNYSLVNVNDINHDNVLNQYDAFIIPDGEYNVKNINQFFKILKHCISSNKPYLGIKLGLKVVVDYFIKSKNNFKNIKGNNYFLGSNEVTFTNKSLFKKIYNADQSNERFWNNWIINNQEFKKINSDLIISGLNKDGDIVALEYDNNIIATLFHPEYLSKPNNPHPIFEWLVKKIK